MQIPQFALELLGRPSRLLRYAALLYVLVELIRLAVDLWEYFDSGSAHIYSRKIVWNTYAVTIRSILINGGILYGLAAIIDAIKERRNRTGQSSHNGLNQPE